MAARLEEAGDEAKVEIVVPEGGRSCLCFPPPATQVDTAELYDQTAKLDPTGRGPDDEVHRVLPPGEAS
ncbi:hypothetical protein ABIA33_002465 [Streptacidiphilus sp. MAP12-16]|uniref:hypothetical protein n=1 Tax=Streptacidiphilus sp. MAP12-16 TaxID=3156300 RepID=UPI0035159570